MTATSQLTKGTRVLHTTKPDWGIGQILEDPNSETIHLFFEYGGERTLQAIAAGKLQVVKREAGQSLLLDNLYLPAPGKSRPMVTMAQAKKRLQELFPGALHGEKMQSQERAYKDELSRFAAATFASTALDRLMQVGQYAEIVELAYGLIKHSRNNFPSPFEKMALGNAIKTHSRSREFAKSFCEWVLPAHPTEQAFEAFAAELDHLGCAKWPILTSYRFLLHPQTDVLIKPTNLANAAEVARFKINYRSELKWLTYFSVMQFYKHVRSGIADLDPKDNIDVQNFIWCIDPEQHPN
jgi:hypothetical protein